MRAYELSHVVAFEETNVVGNVYYANYVRWQGRCREMFLRDHVPGVLDEFAKGLYLVTTRVSCEFFDELRAFDEVLIKMYAKDISANRVTMTFDYHRRAADGRETLIARGEQQVASMQHQDGVGAAVPLPLALKHALQEFLV